MPNRTTKTSKRAPTRKSGTKARRIDEERPGRDKLLELLNSMIRRISSRLEKNSEKENWHALAGDLLKLLAWRKELGPEEVREVTVRWIGNDPESPANG
jgi:hypothetical protein